MNEWIGSKKDQTKVKVVQEKSHEINKGVIVLQMNIFIIQYY